jgi:hypothetical protein
LVLYAFSFSLSFLWSQAFIQMSSITPPKSFFTTTIDIGQYQSELDFVINMGSENVGQY